VVRQAVGADADEQERGDPPSPTAIIVSWADSTSERRTRVVGAFVENTTSIALRVELRLTGMTPSGEIAVRPMGVMDVPPKSVVPVEYSMSDLPAQSTGVASTVSLAALYPSTAPASGGGLATRVLQVTTPSLHVTLDPAGAEGTVRDARAQALANANARPSERQVGSSKVFDATKGQVVDASSRGMSQGERAPAVILAMDGRRGLSEPPGRANRVPVEP
jgi:hypothetical protein